MQPLRVTQRHSRVPLTGRHTNVHCPRRRSHTAFHERSIATATAPIPKSAYVAPVATIQSTSDNPSHTSRFERLRKAPPFSSFLTDSFNRQHTYLRVSITERCNLRCTYCMPEGGVPLSPEDDNLTTSEILLLSELFVSQGVTKIRLTGGEPTVRKDIVSLMQRLGDLRSKGLKELALTTNGVALWRKLDAMAEAGLTGVNLSLDTLDPHLFQIITRRKGFEAVIKSMDRIEELNKLGAGIKLKINCVVTRGVNDREILGFVELGREKDVEVRFIEYMPFNGNKWEEKKMFSYEEMLQTIRSKYPELHRLHDLKGETSKTWQVPGFVGKLGFITSMTENFCGTCNRLRITSDGNLKVCLFGNAEVSLRDLLREGADGTPVDEEAYAAMRAIELSASRSLHGVASILRDPVHERQLLEVIGKAVGRKKARHAGMENLSTMPNRPMILIDDLQHSFSEGVQSVHHTSHEDTSKRFANSQVFHSSRRIQLADFSSISSIQRRCFSSLPSVDPSTNQPGEHATTVAVAKLVVGEKLYNVEQVAELHAAVASARHLSLLQAGCSTANWQRPKVEAETTDVSAEANSSSTEALEGKAIERLIPFMRQLLKCNVVDEKEFKQLSMIVESALSATKEGEKFEVKKLGLDLVAELKKMIEDVIVWRYPEDALSQKFARRNALLKLQKATGETSNQLEQQVDAELTITRSFDKAKSAQATAPLPQVDESSQAIGDKVTGELLTDVDDIGFRTQASYLVSRDAEAGYPAQGAQLPHLTPESNVHMVSVVEKSTTFRQALAIATVNFSNSSVLPAIRSHSLKKGDVLSVARIAAIMGAKRTSDIVPLCHPGLQITNIEVDVEAVNAHNLDKTPTDSKPTFDVGVDTEDVKILGAKQRWLQSGTGEHGGVKIVAKVACAGKTGVEMEALMAASAGALTVVDMCKALDKRMSIDGVKMVYKAGGRSGTFVDHEWLHS